VANVARSTGGSMVEWDLPDAWGRPTRARGVRLSDHAVLVEAADVLGIHKAPPGSSPMTASSAALGALVRAAERYSHGSVVLAVGGTATVDGGSGLLESLGWRLDCDLLVAADVAIPYEEAPRRFAIQKGARPSDVPVLEQRLIHTRNEICNRLGMDPRVVPHAGAGGGVAGALGSLGAKVKSGFEVFSGLVHLQERISAAQAIVTGEGRLDYGTLLGKGPGQIAKLAQAAGIPVWMVVGNNSLRVTDLRSSPMADVRVLSLRDLKGAENTFRAAARLCELAGRLIGAET